MSSTYTLTRQSAPSMVLNSGSQIPAVAYGLWKQQGSEAKDSVRCAIESGYRHLDCATAYQNHKEVGQAIREAGVPRDELWITSKVWGTHFDNPEEGLDDILEELGVEYLDLLLLHLPVAFKRNPEDPKQLRGLPVDHDMKYADVWARMEKLPKSKVRNIGVSNLTVRALDELLQTAKVTPAVNQVEMHPNLPQKKLLDYCKSKGIVVQAYSPLAQGQHENPVVTDIADDLGVSPAQVVLSWGALRGTNILPKSSTPSRIRENLELIQLSDDHMRRIDALARR
uniref:Erythrose reductase n=1 Tax=Yarrowia lipolytica TaxID=4952 RepID=M4LY75_YARLL|nr:erythrose reductase [Yarrowia lipolytica]